MFANALCLAKSNTNGVALGKNTKTDQAYRDFTIMGPVVCISYKSLSTYENNDKIATHHYAYKI